MNSDDPESEDEDVAMNREHEEFLEVQLMVDDVDVSCSEEEISDEEIPANDERGDEQIWVDQQLMSL